MLNFSLPNMASLLCFIRMHSSKDCPQITKENQSFTIVDASAGYRIRLTPMESNPSIFLNIICDDMNNIVNLTFQQTVSESQSKANSDAFMTTSQEDKLMTNDPTSATGTTTSQNNINPRTTALVTMEATNTQPTIKAEESAAITTQLPKSANGYFTTAINQIGSQSCQILYDVRVLSVIDLEGNNRTAGDVLNETESVIVTCDQIDRVQQMVICTNNRLSPVPYCRKPIYVIGGRDEESFLDSIAVFYPDSPSESYIMGPKLPTPRYGHVSFRTAENQLLMFYGESEESFEEIQQYDPETQFWNPKGPMFSSVRYLVVNRIDDGLYVCGGFPSSKLCKIYNLTEETWKSSFPMREIRDRSCSFVLDHKMYVVGGFTGVATVEVLDVVNPTRQHAANSNWKNPANWQYAANYPLKVYACGATSYGGLGYVCGGRVSEDKDTKETSGYTDKCFAYDPITGIWTPMASMNEKRSRFQLVEQDGLIFAVLGVTHSMYSNTVERYDPEGADQWTLIDGMGDLLEARRDFSIV